MRAAAQIRAGAGGLDLHVQRRSAFETSLEATASTADGSGSRVRKSVKVVRWG